jgi:nucleoside-diphosphate-sugar epimerase
MKTLVLGGSVFVGKHMVNTLVAAGHDVSVLNRGKTPTSLPKGVKHIVADRTDVQSMKAALKGATWDAVFDISGFVMASEGSDAKALIELLDGQVGDYVYTSSITAYEPRGVFPWYENDPVVPADPTNYAGFKVAMEQELMKQHAKTGFPASVVRPAAIYGPDNNIFDMETPMFLRLEQNRPILVPHSGLVTCSYGHVDDLCEAMLAICGNEKARGEIFNITAEGVTVNEYIRVLAEIVGVTPNIVEVPSAIIPELTQPAFGHLFAPVHHGIMSIEKAEKLLGVKPRYDFKAGHEHTYAWYKEQGWQGRTEPLVDAMWQASWNFDYEANVAKRILGA